MERCGDPFGSRLEFPESIEGLNPECAIEGNATEGEVNMDLLLPIPIPSVQQQGVGMPIQVEHSPITKEGFNQG